MRVAVGAALALVVAASPAVAAPNNNNSEKLRQAVTLDGVRQHQAMLQAISDATVEKNRFAGFPGHDRSAEYVAEQLRDAGYEPTFHTFRYDAFFERQPSTFSQVSPTPTTYVSGTDWRIMTYSGGGDVTAPLAGPSGDHRGCFAADFSGFPAGSIAIVQRGAPAGFVGSCSFRLKAQNAFAAGASGVVVYNNIANTLLSGTLGATGGTTPGPVFGTTREVGQALVAQMASGPVVVRMFADTGTENVETSNVLAETAGGDPGNVVMVGAHLDSVFAGPGINDNGSGSAAILEVARQMSKVTPRNKVRFAWWSAEESGLIGATNWVNSRTAAQLDAIALYLNFDMIGSPNFARFVYDGDNSKFPAGVDGTQPGPQGSGVIEQVFHGFFESQGLASEPTPFNGRSDYGPFIAASVGIPSGGLFTGAEGKKTAGQAILYGGTAGVSYDPCYHLACDTFANNSDAGLDQMSDAVAHAVITFAQNTELINGVRGKGNFKRPYQGDGQDGGAGGGGGLHDDHDHDEDS